ncbi:hypothetical protein VHEMI10035 [[Torrubiella] hemipterigena]|uniref:Uncharacterized protein n=1 Tax=[Torrubiella] hemipterigena TaxID=1531966 RepID=A0A0A1TBQ0_9HYPO|nr:hypothetical protein VHEMI10035 [[Torrubiella] hemipterigena]
MMRRALVNKLALPTRTVATRRFYSAQPANPTTQFYKTFTRPVAKVLLVAVFTYQVCYWSWVKLEADEMKRETDASIADLEKAVNEYQESKSGKK